MPSTEEVNKILQELEMPKGKKMLFYDLQNILMKLKKPRYIENFDPKKSASHLLIEVIFQNLKKN